ncbi:MAG: NAD(P)-dependent oxidoreductase [Candidatus Levybacteria bacterium]|nr:NAD(P)-dependent oxidoreductase [Candidatus Levybacteria bacterium]
MNKIKILITGSKGTLGSYVSKIFKDKKYELLLTSRMDFDITNKSQIEKYMLKTCPDFVIHLAAKTNVDECERDSQNALLVNTTATEHIAQACKKIGSKLIFISTTAVFDGKKKGYTESDIPGPINTYGKTKLMAEEKIKEILKYYYIIRAGWMIGGGNHEKKFVSYIIKQLNQKEIKVVNDKYGTITYAKELVEFIKKIIEGKFIFGLYHFGSSGICSRFDIAKRIIKILEKDNKIVPVLSKEFEHMFYAKRPKYEVLKSKKIPFVSTWKKSLENYLRYEII